MPVVCKAHSSSENWIGDIRSSKTNVTAAAMSLGVALRAPVSVASCFRSGVTETYPGCPAGVAMIYIVVSGQIVPVIDGVVFRMVASRFNVANLAAEKCADDPSV
jgi:hypothetical protein